MSSSRPLLVVTPTLGRSPWLIRTVASVAEYAGERATHVLVAPSGTLAMLGRQFPNCTLVADTAAAGVYAAINLGLANAPEADWRWFTWINDDDEFKPGFASHLARTLQNDGRDLKAPWTYGQVQLLNGNDDNLGRIAIARIPTDILSLAQAGVNPLNQQGMLAPRAWVNLNGPIREDLRICADVDFWLRAFVAGARFRCSAEIVALFRLRSGQISGDVELHREEFQKVVQTVAGPSRRRIFQWIARVRFLIGNAGLYFDRIQRCGWKGGFALLERPVRRTS